MNVRYANTQYVPMYKVARELHNDRLLPSHTAMNCSLRLSVDAILLCHIFHILTITTNHRLLHRMNLICFFSIFCPFPRIHILVYLNSENGMEKKSAVLSRVIACAHRDKCTGSSAFMRAHILCISECCSYA